MRKLEIRNARELDHHLNEFHEVCELHSCGQLIEVAFYDSALDDGSAVLGYVVSVKRVASPDDIMHVFDHVAQRTSVALNASGSARQEIVTYAQTLNLEALIAFDKLDEALAYANGEIAALARDRSHY
jgi:hypothetical protein